MVCSKPRHATHRVVTSVFALLLLTSLALLRHARSKHHYLAPEHLGATHSPERLSPAEATSLCRQHGFTPYPHARRVYEILLVNTELDLLEIRLHTLAPYIDHFIIIESDRTFRNAPKPLHVNASRALFSSFDSQIIHRIIRPRLNSSRTWDHEDWQRSAGLLEVFPQLLGSQAASPGDALLVSDMDEIIRPAVAHILRYCDFPSRLTLRSDMYYYSFQWLHAGEPWHHPDATVYRGDATLTPTELRQGLLGPGWAPVASLRRWWDRATIWDAGWHCSSCFSRIADLRTKMASFSHVSLDTAENRAVGTMVQRVREGKDLFGRQEEEYVRVEGNVDLPQYILRQNEDSGRFGYLLDRDGEDAGFEDWRDVVGKELLVES